MAYTTIDDPSAYFQTALYTGGGGAKSITNDGNSDLQPDLVWIKHRSGTEDNLLFDSTRGTEQALKSNSTGAEFNYNSSMTAFNSDGFSVGTANGVNGAGTFVGWQWKANGGTTSSNTDGSLTSTVQANTDAGFTIVQYSPSDSTQRTIGHGMGSTPDIVWIRARNRVEDTWFYHGAIGLSGALINSTAAYNTSPASTALKGVGASTFTVGTNPVVNGAYNYIAYCWKEVQGYSKFGKYTGNGSSNGPFVYTGFKPAFVMIKNASAVESWAVYDTARNTFNIADLKLSPDTADAENNNSAIGGAAYNNIDILSNGFKCRTNNAATNGSGNTLIYMAFAENPFVTSTGIPTTAR